MKNKNLTFSTHPRHLQGVNNNKYTFKLTKKINKMLLIFFCCLLTTPLLIAQLGGTFSHPNGASNNCEPITFLNTINLKKIVVASRNVSLELLPETTNFTYDSIYIIRTSDGYRNAVICTCLLYTSPSPRDRTRSRMPSSA